MTKKEIRQKAIALKQEIMIKRSPSKSKISDIILLLECHEKQDYTAMWSTTLYRKYSGEYCELLQYI